MIYDNKKIVAYLESSIGDVYKILPLYENSNVGLKTYVESLLFRIYGWEHSIAIGLSYEYLSLVSILESIKIAVDEKDNKLSIVRREVFNCINFIKSMVEKLEVGE